MNHYKIKGRKGIDDLKPLYAFQSAEQGSNYQTNSISEYENSKGWLIPIFKDLTQEGIAKQIVENSQWNLIYVTGLLKTNTFGEEYEINMFMQPNELLDSPVPDTLSKPKSSLTSYKMIFLDFKNKDS